MYDLIVSVVTFNNPISVLDQLIQSTTKSSLRVKIVFIDNSKKPNIEAYCQLQLIDYLPNSNIGFGGAHNIVMRKLIDSFNMLINLKFLSIKMRQFCVYGVFKKS